MAHSEFNKIPRERLRNLIGAFNNKVKDAESDLMGIAEKIFDMSGGDQTAESEKPKCLWSLFYNVKDTSAPVASVENVVIGVVSR